MTKIGKLLRRRGVVIEYPTLRRFALAELDYLGGGNARHLKLTLPRHVRITSNVAGVLGGIALWGVRPRRIR